VTKLEILDNEDVGMWCHPESRILHHKFRRYVWGATLREALNRGATVFIEHGASKWLSDDRSNGALSKADTEWAMNDWFPRVQKAGWKYWAIVLPDNAVGEKNMQRFVAAYSELGVTAQVFGDPVAAMAWLEKQGR
jgi:hypothetical protein